MWADGLTTGSRAVAEPQVRFVLDVGCGSGFNLRSLTNESGAYSVGIDIAQDVGAVARKSVANGSARTNLTFLRASAEALPFRSGTFDVVLCQLSLPYTHNPTALSELARVLAPQGLILLRIHHLRYYLSMLARAVRQYDVRRVAYALRVLAGGTIYQATKIQSKKNILGREVFQTRWSLERDLQRVGLGIVGIAADSTTKAPSFIITQPPQVP